jgi:hypothetical protein
MIYRPITTPEGFKRFDNIPLDYYCCGWVIGETVAKSVTKENEPLTPPTYPNGPAILDGIATLVSDGWEYFLESVANEGITIPPELLEDE